MSMGIYSPFSVVVCMSGSPFEISGEAALAGTPGGGSWTLTMTMSFYP